MIFVILKNKYSPQSINFINTLGYREMLVRIKNIAINIDQITKISIHENERFMGTGEPQNFVIVSFSGDEHQKISFESNDQLKSFLNYTKVLEI